MVATRANTCIVLLSTIKQLHHINSNNNINNNYDDNLYNNDNNSRSNNRYFKFLILNTTLFNYSKNLTN
jgi:hypothetical protein